MKKALLFFCILSISTIIGNNDLQNKNDKNGGPEKTIFCVLKHSPGPKWEKGVPFQEQSGVMNHVKYMSKQLENGFLVMGGPFLDNSGGMMICRTSNIEEAKKIAEADPGVTSGLLNVEVSQWLVAMNSVDLSPRK